MSEKEIFAKYIGEGFKMVPGMQMRHYNKAEWEALSDLQREIALHDSVYEIVGKAPKKPPKSEE
jgi:hypothetical protein